MNPTVRIAEPKKPKKDNTHFLYIAVIVAVVAGIIFGLVAPAQAAELKVLGTAFVALIKMMIAPVVFCTIVLGIGSVRAAASVGKAGGIALAYFVVMSTCALAIGMVVANFIHPGTGLTIPADHTAQQVAGDANTESGFLGFVHEFVPETLVSALTSGSVLQALFVALLCGFAIQGMGRAGEPILTGIAHLQKLVFRILMMVLWVAPIGAFGAIAGVVGGTGFAAVGALGVLMLCFYLTCILFVCGVLGLLLLLFARVNVFRLLKYLGREFLLIFATSSSESALPNLMRKMEFLGVQKSTVGIVVPTGYSFNLDGTAIYLTMSSIFIAEAMGKPLNIPEQITLLLFMIIASKGAAGVSGAGIATLGAGLQSHRPELVDGVGIIVGIDRFMSEARAITNFAGNAIATVLIGTWTRTIDRERAQNVLHGKIKYKDAQADEETNVNLRFPSVVNPADKLQPTPQVDIDTVGNPGNSTNSGGQ